jgi:hypothetical protein
MGAGLCGGGSDVRCDDRGRPNLAPATADANPEMGNVPPAPKLCTEDTEVRLAENERPACISDPWLCPEFRDGERLSGPTSAA